jgi:glycosyltransferase involved in cell wall biosynthesis
VIFNIASIRPLAVIVDACSHRTGGGLTYLSNLLPLLAREPGIGAVIAVVEPPAALAGLLDGTEVRVVRRRGPGGVAGRLFWEACALGRGGDGAVVLAPNSMLPRKPPAATVAVAQNMLPFVSSRPRTLVQRAATERTLRWADGAIFVSEAMRRAVGRVTALPARARVIPHGLEDAFRVPVTGGRPRRGIVVVADRNPHKRLGLALAAWTRLGRDRPPLRVLGADRFEAGPPGTSFESGLSAAEVADAMRRAALVVVTSRAESFGFPALEALACETPLVVSDIPALREVTGGHAVFVNSDRAEHWSEAVRVALHAPALVAVGREWALRFTWEQTASATAAILLEAHRAHAGASSPAIARGGRW